MLRRYSILVITLLISFQGFSQINKNGIPVIKNFSHYVTNGSEQNWCVTQDHRGVIYIGNNDKGVLEYDGSEWRSIPVTNNSYIRSLATADDGTVYVGAVAEIGYLTPDENGELYYKSLLPLLDTIYHRFTDVWKSYADDEYVYFCSETFITIYNTETKSFNVLGSYEHTLFGFFELGKLYFGAFIDGLVELQGDTIVKSPGGEFYAKKNVFALTEYDTDHLLIGTPQDGLSLYNVRTGVASHFGSSEANNFIQSNLTYHLLKLPTNEFLASTSSGGLGIISHDGELVWVISEPEGLLDITSYNSYVNPKSAPYPPVWSAMSLGVARTDLNSPITSFTIESGFQGLIADIETLDDVLYVGTSTGLYASVIINGKRTFNPVGVNFAIWKLQKFVLQNGEDVLLAITDDGVFQIRKNGETIRIEDELIDMSMPEGSKYWGYTLIQDPFKTNRIILGRERDISYFEYRKGNWYEVYTVDKIDDEARSLAFDNDGTLWFGTPLAGIGKVNPDDTLTGPVYYGEEDGLPPIENNFVFRIGDEILFGTKKGIYRYNGDDDRFVKDTIYDPYLPEGDNWIFVVHKDKEDCIWFSIENSELGWMIIYLEKKDDKYEAVTKPFMKLSNGSSTDAFFSEENGSIWFPKSNVLYHFQKGYTMQEGSYKAMVRKVTIGADSVIFYGAYPIAKEGGFNVGDAQVKEDIPHIKYSDNNIEFRWSAPYFDMEEEVEYSYFLEGFSKDWTKWEKVFYQDFTNLSQGPYTFRIKARNTYNDESLEDVFSFVIGRPWYASIVAFFAYLILAVLIVYVIIVLYTRRLKNENIRLEGIIQERTAEIRKQKEELTDSIEYASRIQRAMLPPKEILDEHKLDHFILFRPRDIVSGDFYWIGVKEEKIYIVAADCTGHGVPGAFMSMLGISFLDEIIIKSGISETNEILDSLKQHVITSLRQTGKSMEESTKDGMDLAMISIDEENKTVQYSGAYNPLYSVRKLNAEEKSILAKGEELSLERGDLNNDTHLLTQVRADQMPIGISEKNFAFSAKSLTEFDGATLYLFSDGYVDQFGGPNGKKFMAKNFKKLLLEIQGQSMEEQHETLNQTLVEWMADIDQIDDVLIIGIKLA